MNQLDRIEQGISYIKSLLDIKTSIEETKAVKGLYDEHGISYEVSKYGGVKLKAVEELFQDWINKGGKYKKIAESMNHWFCFLRPETPLKPDVYNQINANQGMLSNYILFGSKYVSLDQYHEVHGNYQHKITKKYAFKLPDYYDPDRKNWITTQSMIIKPVPNHFVAKFGNVSNTRNPEFYTEFVDKIPDAIERIMLKMYENIDSYKWL